MLYTPTGKSSAVSLPAKIPLESKLLDCALLVIVSSFLIVMLSFALWGLDRGLDIWDEGFYLLMTSTVPPYTGLSGFHFVLAQLPKVTGSLLIDLRLFQVISQLISNVVLTWGFWRLMSSVWFTPTKTQFFTSLAFTTLGSFLFQATFPASLSYNGLTHFFILSSFGLLFAGKALAQPNFKVSNCLLVGAGFLSGMVLSIKCPAFIASSLLAALWLELNFSQPRLCFYYLVGLLVSLIVFFTLFQSPLQYQGQWIEAAKVTSLSNPFSFPVLVQNYLTDFDYMVSSIWHDVGIFFFAPILAAITIVAILRQASSPRTQALSRLIPIAFLTPLMLLAGLGDHPPFRSYPLLYAGILVFSAVTLIFIVANSNRFDTRTAQTNRIVVSSILLLFLIPFACSVGTSNPPVFQTSTCISPVFLALSVLSFKAFPDFCSSAYRFSLIGGMTILVFSLFVFGYLSHPYMIWDSLFNQNCDAGNLSNLKGVKLGRDAHQFLTSVSSILRKGGFSTGDPILAFYNMPGVVYSAGGRAPGLAWLFARPDVQNVRPLWFQMARNDIKEKLFVLTCWDLAPKTQKQLRQAGINFPNDFELLGTTEMKPYKDSCGLLNSGGGDRYLNGEVRVYKWKH